MAISVSEKYCDRSLSYHGEVEDSSHRPQPAGLVDESLRPLQRADITGVDQHLHAPALPFTHPLGLVT